MKRTLLAVVALGFLAALPPGDALAQAFPVNVTTAESQHLPDVAGLAGGGFVAVWWDYSSWGIKGRLFESSGLPKGGEIEITRDAINWKPRVAAAPDGGFVAVWSVLGDVRFRRFDAAGHPLGEVVQAASQAGSPDVAVNGAGNILVVYATHNQVFLRRFGPDGLPLGNAEAVPPQPVAPPMDPRIAVNASGSLLVSWGTVGYAVLSARRFDAATGAWGPQAVITPGPGHRYLFGAVPVLYPEGDGALVCGRDQEVALVRLNSAGLQAGNLEGFGDRRLDLDPPDVATDANGNSLVVWSALAGVDDSFTGYSAIRARLFDRSWHPLGAAFTVRPNSELYDGEPAVAALGRDGFAVLWANGDLVPDIVTTPAPPRDGEDGSQLGVFGRIVSPAACVAGSEVLCLGPEGRFEVRATWKTPAGQTGTARALPLTADTGALWFFDSKNLEIMIKVLDAHTVNGYFWVFYGSLSNLEYTITVKDSQTGEEKTYKNAQRQLASKADVRAFAYLEPTGIEKALPAADPPPSNTALSLVEDRFEVEVSFTDPRTGLAGLGQAVPLTGDTGAFWFFDPENLELMLKILDGRASNGHFWVFFGGLSDVQYTVTIRDKVTGQSRVYRNNRRQLLSYADVEAF